MSQIVINSENIKTFGFTATIDLANRKMVFDISKLTEFEDDGGANIVGINFSLNDASGNPLIPGNKGEGTWDWMYPNITEPHTDANPNYSGQSTFEVDLAAIFGNNYTALFQNFRVQAAIKDDDLLVYQTAAVIHGVAMPPGFTDLGYVEGLFTLKADCPNGFLTVKEVTNMAYCGKLPISQHSVGTLYYPRGTINPIPYEFNSTVVFTNNVVYTGSYKIINTTTALYDDGAGFYTQIEYYTESEKFDVTCEKSMLSVMCCLIDFQENMMRNCTGAQFQAMHDKWTEAGTYLALGLAKESSGRDASEEALKIRHLLNCDCVTKSIKKIAPDPVNPMVYSIVIDGKFGTKVTPSVVGNTKTFEVESNVYRVKKFDPNDLSFHIGTNSATPGLVEYIISFDYEKLAQHISPFINSATSTIGTPIDLCSVDYNGNVTRTTYPATTSIIGLLTAMASVGCSNAEILKTLMRLAAGNGLSVADLGGIPTVIMGGNPLYKNTDINQKAFNLQYFNQNAEGITTAIRLFGPTYTTLLAALNNLGPTNVVTMFNSADQNALQVTTNAERALVAYLAKSKISQNASGITLGSFIPATDNPAVSPPLEDPLKTAYLKFSEGKVEYKGKEHVVQGAGTWNFYDTVPIIRVLNTAQRLALTPVIGMMVLEVDSGGIMWWNASIWMGIRYISNTLQAYDGTTWKTLEFAGTWVSSTTSTIALSGVSGSVDSSYVSHVVRVNSVTIDFNIAVTVAAGTPTVKLTLPVNCIAGKKFHTSTFVSVSPTKSVPVYGIVNLTGADPDKLTLSSFESLTAGSYTYMGQITYQTL